MEKFYTKTHEWLSFTPANTALVGVTAYLVKSQKNPSCINLCDEGDFLNAGDNAGDIEFLKGVFDIHAPVSGVVVRVNDSLLLHPETLKEEPETWILELEDVKRSKPLLTSAEYEAFLQSKGVRT